MAYQPLADTAPPQPHQPQLSRTQKIIRFRDFGFQSQSNEEGFQCIDKLISGADGVSMYFHRAEKIIRGLAVIGASFPTAGGMFKNLVAMTNGQIGQLPGPLTGAGGAWVSNAAYRLSVISVPKKRYQRDLQKPMTKIQQIGYLLNLMPAALSAYFAGDIAKNIGKMYDLNEDVVLSVTLLICITNGIASMYSGGSNMRDKTGLEALRAKQIKSWENLYGWFHLLHTILSRTLLPLTYGKGAVVFSEAMLEPYIGPIAARSIAGSATTVFNQITAQIFINMRDVFFMECPIIHQKIRGMNAEGNYEEDSRRRSHNRRLGIIQFVFGILFGAVGAYAFYNPSKSNIGYTLHYLLDLSEDSFINMILAIVTSVLTLPAWIRGGFVAGEALAGGIEQPKASLDIQEAPPAAPSSREGSRYSGRSEGATYTRRSMNEFGSNFILEEDNAPSRADRIDHLQLRDLEEQPYHEMPPIPEEP
jgi:hypothetical protein